MAIVVKGFLCKEKWKDDKGRDRERRHGRLYHSRSACEAMVELVRRQPAEAGMLRRQVVVTEDYGEDGINA